MLLDVLRNRMHKKNMSNFIIIVGKKGAGKSYLSLRLAELLQNDFSLDNVCFSTKDLLQKLTSKQLKRWDVVILEEIGVAANARNAMSNLNKALSYAAQIIRPMAITLIANTISWALVDAQVKNLADYKIEVLGHDRATKTTFFRFYEIEPSNMTQQPLMKYLTVRDENGVLVKISSWKIQAPDENLAKKYEVMREEYMHRIYSASLEKIEKAKEREDGTRKRKKR